MARRRASANSVAWIVLWIEAAALVLGLLIALAGAVVFDSDVVIRFGLMTAAGALGFGLIQLIVLFDVGLGRAVMESNEESEAQEWANMRRRRFAQARKLMRENPPKPQSPASPDGRANPDSP